MALDYPRGGRPTRPGALAVPPEAPLTSVVSHLAAVAW
jgi:hypothetical protein